MTRSAILPLAGAVAATLLLAACNRDAPAPATQAPPAPVAPAPAPEPPPPAPATVTSVELGNAIDASNRVTTPASEFASTDTIYASVGTDGGNAARLTARWTYGEAGQLVRSTDADVPAGPQVVAFDIQHPDGWPTGNYTLEVQLDGTTVETRTFSVR